MNMLGELILTETLKMFTIAMISNASLLVSDTLMTQIIREERQRENQHSMAALFVKPGRSSAKSTNSIPISNSIHNPNSNAKLNHLKPKKGRTHPHCTNPKCMRIGHTIEHCWAKGGGLEGQQPIVPRNPQSRNVLLSRESGKNKDGKVAILIAYDHTTVADSHFHSTEWIIDSGVTSHICTNRSWFTSYSILNPPHPIILGDKHTVHAIGQGQINISIPHGPDNWHAMVQDVLHCPNIRTNLLSISHLTNVNLEVRFVKNQCFLINSNEECIGIAQCLNGLYRLPCTVMSAERIYISKDIESRKGNVETAQVARTMTTSASVDVWHCHLGHISIDSILKV